MDDDAAAGLIALIVIGAALLCGGVVIWALYKLGEYVVDHPDQVLKALGFGVLVLTAPLWLPPLIAARLILLVLRDVPVYTWQLSGNHSPRRRIVFWVVGFPLTVALGALIGLVVVARWNTQPIPWFVAYSGFFLVALEGSYVYLYFCRPLHHHNWPIFIAAEEDIRFDIHSAIALRRYRVRMALSVPGAPSGICSARARDAMQQIWDDSWDALGGCCLSP